MSSENQDPENGEPVSEIILLKIAESYYLAEGEEYLSELMLVDGTFPKPLRCLNFEDAFKFSTFSGGTISLADLWGINPKIISRLRQEGHLLEVDVS